ncbi:MAG: hypothetical protein GY753_18305 [Gammaproteobacteria bacterium]|nr:hypothetical protein [Gammaproteobacteria bacterium]
MTDTYGVLENLILPTLIALIAAASGLWVARNQQRKNSSEGAERLVDVALKLHTRLQAEVARLNNENSGMEGRLVIMEEEIEILTEQVRVLGQYTIRLIHQAKSHNLDPIVGLDDIEEVMGEGDGP